MVGVSKCGANGTCAMMDMSDKNGQPARASSAENAMYVKKTRPEDSEPNNWFYEKGTMPQDDVNRATGEKRKWSKIRDHAFWRLCGWTVMHNHKAITLHFGDYVVKVYWTNCTRM